MLLKIQYSSENIQFVRGFPGLVVAIYGKLLLCHLLRHSTVFGAVCVGVIEITDLLLDLCV